MQRAFERGDFRLPCYAAGMGASTPAHKFIVFSSSRPHAFR